MPEILSTNDPLERLIWDLAFAIEDPCTPDTIRFAAMIIGWVRSLTPEERMGLLTKGMRNG